LANTLGLQWNQVLSLTQLPEKGAAYILAFGNFKRIKIDSVPLEQKYLSVK